MLDVRQDFASQYPAYVVRVLEAYERAHSDALADPNALYEAFERKTNLPEAIARRVLARTDLASARLGEPQANAIAAAGEVLKRSGVIPADSDVPAITRELLEPSFLAQLRPEHH